ncbi:hypothetical protein SAMN05660733_07380 [Lentzea albidocapillata]|uniref:Uncharacterized protein n=1 Tax=Lentzea albidocapillata TaxID=40571 RepID=A0A1W2FPF3_9PSEU|nr:hypothetical protein SAMN05660733_07380 [Lentzea albidocapillata]
MWTINQMEQFSQFGGVLEMSHREEPRSGRGCFGAVVVVPFLALGGMFVLIALTGSPSEAPLAAPPPSRPTSQWWTEPFEAGVSLATVTETVVVEGAAREVRAARTATQTRVVGSTITETVRVSSAKPVGVGRNEPGEPVESGEEEPVPTSASPVVTSSVVVSSVEPAPPAEAPGSVPPVEAPPSSTPRAEDPVSPVVTPPVTSPVEPPCDRTEPPVERSLPPSDEADVSVEVSFSASLAGI